MYFRQVFWASRLTVTGAHRSVLAYCGSTGASIHASSATDDRPALRLRHRRTRPSGRDEFVLATDQHAEGFVFKGQGVDSGVVRTVPVAIL